MENPVNFIPYIYDKFYINLISFQKCLVRSAAGVRFEVFLKICNMLQEKLDIF